MKKYLLNKLKKDKWNKISGILALNKERGITSHDLVDKVRKKIGTQKVGHTGALDPFATGLMIILVESATKLSNQYIHMDKTYNCKILLGISTSTQDPEGEVVHIEKVTSPKKNQLEKTLNFFKKNYYQYVPIYSSAKISGIRLREYAHNSKNYEIKSSKDTKIAKFKLKPNTRIIKKLKKKKMLRKDNTVLVEIPRRDIQIKELRLENIKLILGSKLNLKTEKNISDKSFYFIDVTATVSKGTYMRQLAEDIGERLGNVPAMLYELKRTHIGKLSLKNSISIEELKKN